MHKLNSVRLRRQCERIKAMIQKVAEDPKYRDDYYAKKYHHWQLSPVVPMSEIEEFERRSGVELPEGYVYYLSFVGGGGASPGTGFHDFKADWAEIEHISEESEQLSRVWTKKEWEEQYGRHKMVEPGTLDLGAIDLTFIAYLVLTGPMKGKVVYLDWDGDCAPMWPKGSAEFLDWCENFYSELLAGYDIDPTWKFMWREPGDADALIDAFYRASDVEYKKEVIYSFAKFQMITKQTRQFLKGVEPEYQKEAIEVLEYFDKKQKK